MVWVWCQQIMENWVKALECIILTKVGKFLFSLSVKRQQSLLLVRKFAESLNVELTDALRIIRLSTDIFDIYFLGSLVGYRISISEAIA